MAGKAARDSEKSQIERFREAARELETDNREEALNSAIRKLVKRPEPAKPEKE